MRETIAPRTDESTTKPAGPGPGPMLYCAGFAMVCTVCQKDEQEVTLSKCPICFKPVCQDCGRREYGRVFCSQRCAHLFFFGDDEDE